MRLMAYFMLLVCLVFAVMVSIVALWRRESVFDVMEFDGKAFFRKARIVAVVLIVLAFFTLFIINNTRGPQAP